MGFPGDITRSDVSNVEAKMLLAVATVFPQAFGVPMVYGVGGVQVFGASNVAVDFAGILVREVPAIAASSAADLVSFPTAPNPKQPTGLMVRGYMAVLCPFGTPAAGGIVYVRTVANGNGVVGDFNATADGANSVALSATQAIWNTDGKDVNGVAEIRVYR